MKTILSIALLAVTAAPAFALEIAPSPSVGLGVPAAGAIVAVGVAAFLIKRKKK